LKPALSVVTKIQ
jgi:ectoine hydroxylase-related dioxygenase (phytanoyl-CoA dioxygenase family)